MVEKFPMELISDPTAYTSNDPRELYNNILIFIVREDPKSKNPNQSEMHIFQCARVFVSISFLYFNNNNKKSIVLMYNFQN